MQTYLCIKNNDNALTRSNQPYGFARTVQFVLFHLCAEG